MLDDGVDALGPGGRRQHPQRQQNRDHAHDPRERDGHGRDDDHDGQGLHAVPLQPQRAAEQGRRGVLAGAGERHEGHGGGEAEQDQPGQAQGEREAERVHPRGAEDSVAAQAGGAVARRQGRDVLDLAAVATLDQVRLGMRDGVCRGGGGSEGHDADRSRMG